MVFQLFVSSVPIQCVPTETLPAAFTWHCPGSVGKKREKLPLYPRLLPWKPTNGRDIKTVVCEETLWATLPAWLLYFSFFFFFFSQRFPALCTSFLLCFWAFCSSLWCSSIMGAVCCCVSRLMTGDNTLMHFISFVYLWCYNVLLLIFYILSFILSFFLYVEKLRLILINILFFLTFCLLIVLHTKCYKTVSRKTFSNLMCAVFFLNVWMTISVNGLIA